MKKNGANRKSSKSRQGKTDLKPVVAIMNKLATRMTQFDKKMDSIRTETAQKLDKSGKESVSFRKETAEQFKVSRMEMKQEIQSVRKDMAQEFKKSRKETKQEIQSVRKDTAKYYFAAREENRIIADEHARTLTQTYTTMDAMAKDCSRWLFEKQITDARLSQHTREIDALKENDATREITLHDLRKHVVALENTKNGKPTSPEPVSKIETQH